MVDSYAPAELVAEPMSWDKFGPRVGYTASWATVMGVLYSGKEEIGRIVNGNVRATPRIGKCIRDLILTRRYAESLGLKKNPLRNDDWVKGGLVWSSPQRGLDVKFYNRYNDPLASIEDRAGGANIFLEFRNDPRVRLNLKVPAPETAYHLLTDSAAPNIEAMILPNVSATGELNVDGKRHHVSARLYIDAVWMNGRKTKWQFGNVFGDYGRAFYYSKTMQRDGDGWKTRGVALATDSNGAERNVWSDFKVEPKEFQNRPWKVSSTGLDAGFKPDTDSYEDPVKRFGLSTLRVEEVLSKADVRISEEEPKSA